MTKDEFMLVVIEADVMPIADFCLGENLSLPPRFFATVEFEGLQFFWRSQISSCFQILGCEGREVSYLQTTFRSLIDLLIVLKNCVSRDKVLDILCN